MSFRRASLAEEDRQRCSACGFPIDPKRTASGGRFSPVTTMSEQGGERVFTETFEKVGGTGTDEAYSDILISAGNSLDADFATAGIGSPSGWGTYCARVTVGADEATAVWSQERHTSRNGYTTTLEARLSTDGLTDGTGITIAIAKPSPLTGSVAAWRLYFWHTGAITHFLWTVGDNAELYSFPNQALGGGAISLNTVYPHTITYDIKRKTFSWTVGDILAASGTILSTWPDTIGCKVIGSSGSSTGRNTVYETDNHVWTEYSHVYADTATSGCPFCHSPDWNGSASLGDMDGWPR